MSIRKAFFRLTGKAKELPFAGTYNRMTLEEHNAWVRESNYKAFVNGARPIRDPDKRIAAISSVGGRTCFLDSDGIEIGLRELY